MRNDLVKMRIRQQRCGASTEESRGWIPAAGAEILALSPRLRRRILQGFAGQGEFAVRRSWFSRLEAPRSWRTA